MPAMIVSFTYVAIFNNKICKTFITNLRGTTDFTKLPSAVIDFCLQALNVNNYQIFRKLLVSI